MDEDHLVGVTDGEETYMGTRNGETWGSLIDFFISRASMADRLQTAIDLATTSDQAVVCTHL